MLLVCSPLLSNTPPSYLGSDRLKMEHARELGTPRLHLELHAAAVTLNQCLEGGDALGVMCSYWHAPRCFLELHTLSLVVWAGSLAVSFMAAVRANSLWVGCGGGVTLRSYIGLWQQ